MTDEEKEAERVKLLASAVFRALSDAHRLEDYVRKISKKHGDHPAFTAYMRDMCLTDSLAEFISRPELKIR